jgi:hypothetical protein
MLRPNDSWFLEKEEPVKCCLQYMRKLIIGIDENIRESWQYGMPFFCYKGNRFCYLWIHKQLGKPYLGIVDGKMISSRDLVSEKRSRMKILLVDPNKHIPVQKIQGILKQVLNLYKQ